MKAFIYFSVVYFFSFSIIAQSFEKIYGSVSNDEFQSVVQLSSGDFIVCGTKSQSVLGGSDVYLARIDQQGQVLWDNLYGGVGDDVAYSLVLTSNGNVVVAASSSSFNGGADIDVLLFEIDVLGGLRWSRNYRKAFFNEIPRKINQSPSGLIVCATIATDRSISPDFLVFEVSLDGSILNWQNSIGVQGNYGDLPKTIISSNSGGYILTGGSHTPAKLYDQVVIRLDNTGRIQSNIVFGGNGNEDASDVIELPNNDLLVMGNFRLLSGPGLEIALSKIKPDNTIAWSKAYGDRGLSDERAYGFGRTNTGGYVISGYSSGLGNGGNDILLITTDQRGDLLSSSIYGTPNNETSTDLVVNTDGSYTISGISDYIRGYGLNDGVLIKTNMLGLISGSCIVSNILQNNLQVVSSSLIYNQTNPGITISNPLMLRAPIDYPSFNRICPILPVELLYFKVDKPIDNNNVYLKWATAREFNNAYFLLERSLDGDIWDSVGFYKSKVEIEGIRDYELIDDVSGFKEDLIYYRLKQVDLNGSYKYYDIISVCLICSGDGKQIELYPNPVNQFLELKFIHSFGSRCQVVIRNILGDIVFDRVYYESNKLNLDLGHLVSGIYNISIVTEEFLESYKIIKQ